MPIRVDRRGCSYRPTRMLVSTDADARIDRRGCSYRPTQMLVTTDADARINRRGSSNHNSLSGKTFVETEKIVKFARV
ncbi:hypothetical protein [Leyella stercorea]|uniref:hypothetical protein n=1 Tax=Leyella stercorea TaxID=363265 RepID=UPI002674AC43|nr:hypothetical protein [Leyella stercorea]